MYTALLTSLLECLFMKFNLENLRTEYSQLQKQLAALGWISQGYVQDRGPGAGGPCYQWTRKVKGKTVTETFSSAASLAKAQREVAECQRFRELGDQFLEVNEQICAVRPARLASAADLLDLPGPIALSGQFLSLGGASSPSAGSAGAPPGARRGHQRLLPSACASALGTAPGTDPAGGR